MQEFCSHYNPPHEDDAAAAAASAEMEAQMQQQLPPFDMENCYNAGFKNIDININNSHLMQEVIQCSNQGLPFDHGNWDAANNLHDQVQDVNLINLQHHHAQDDRHEMPFNSSSSLTPDLLNLFQPPRCPASNSSLPNSSISFENPNSKSPNFNFSSLGILGDPSAADCPAPAPAVLYDPLLHLNLPQQPPHFRDLFQSLPQGCGLSGNRPSSLFNRVDDGEANEGPYQEGDTGTEHGVFEFTRDMRCIGKGRHGKGGKHFATEKQRREQMGDLYNALKSVVPNPSKTYRASILGDAIEYIKELLRTVKELQLLVEKKRRGRERRKRHHWAESSSVAAGDADSCVTEAAGELEQSYNGSLRCSWLQRKSKNTEVDVRIIEDEVTIKLVQRKKINCLLFVSKILDELQLDLHHVAGGHISDHYSFLFNTKVYEGSSVYASAIANKLIEIVDGQFAAVNPPTTSF